MERAQSPDQSRSGFSRRALSFALGCACLAVAIIGAEVYASWALKLQGPRRQGLEFAVSDREALRRSRQEAWPNGDYPMFPPSKRQPPQAWPLLRRDLVNRIEPSDAFRAWDSGEYAHLILAQQSYRIVRETADEKIRVWDLEYGIDEFRRRRTLQLPVGEAEPMAVLLLGDSRVYGEGVEDHATLASQLASRIAAQSSAGHKHQAARVYNYGMTGLYPGELLDRVRLIQEDGEVPERRGLALWFMSYHHVTRHAGLWFELGLWGHAKPYYARDEAGFRSQGSWKRMRPIWTALAQIFVRSHWVQFNSWNFPIQPSKSDWEAYLSLADEVRRELRRLGDFEFRVVLWPDMNADTELILPRLAEAGTPFRWVDFSHWPMGVLTHGEDRIPYDGHPTAEAHGVFANGIFQWMKGVGILGSID